MFHIPVGVWEQETTCDSSVPHPSHVSSCSALCPPPDCDFSLFNPRSVRLPLQSTPPPGATHLRRVRQHLPRLLRPYSQQAFALQRFAAPSPTRWQTHTWFRPIPAGPSSSIWNFVAPTSGPRRSSTSGLSISKAMAPVGSTPPLGTRKSPSVPIAQSARRAPNSRCRTSNCGSFHRCPERSCHPPIPDSHGWQY